MLNNTLPKEDSYFWQLEILPCITIFRYKEGKKMLEEMEEEEGTKPYYSITISWLFWSYTFHINK